MAPSTSNCQSSPASTLGCGLRLSGPLEAETPVFVAASGAKLEMLAVRDEMGGVWWVQSDRWEDGAHGRPGRHLSQLQRTMGRYVVEIGCTRLRIEAVDTGLGRADLERYLEDFKAELIWLAMDDASLATGGAGVQSDAYGAELAQALRGFATAARDALRLPASEMHETMVTPPHSPDCGQISSPSALTAQSGRHAPPGTHGGSESRRP